MLIHFDRRGVQGMQSEAKHAISIPRADFNERLAGAPCRDEGVNGLGRAGRRRIVRA